MKFKRFLVVTLEPILEKLLLISSLTWAVKTILILDTDLNNLYKAAKELRIKGLENNIATFISTKLWIKLTLNDYNEKRAELKITGELTPDRSKILKEKYPFLNWGMIYIYVIYFKAMKINCLDYLFYILLFWNIKELLNIFINHVSKFTHGNLQSSLSQILSRSMPNPPTKSPQFYYFPYFSIPI